MSQAVARSKNRSIHGAGRLRTKVKHYEDYEIGQSKAATAVVKHQSIQFSNRVQGTIEEAGRPPPCPRYHHLIRGSTVPPPRFFEKMYGAPLPVYPEPSRRGHATPIQYRRWRSGFAV